MPNLRHSDPHERTPKTYIYSVNVQGNKNSSV